MNPSWIFYDRNPKGTNKIEEINKKVKKYQDDIVEGQRGRLVSKIVKMSMDVIVPDSPRDENGNVIDSNFTFKYYRSHYWDNVDLRDDALVNNPVFHNKLEYFFGDRIYIVICHSQQLYQVVQYLPASGNRLFQYMPCNLSKCS